MTKNKTIRFKDDEIIRINDHAWERQQTFSQFVVESVLKRIGYKTEPDRHKSGPKKL